ILMIGLLVAILAMHVILAYLIHKSKSFPASLVWVTGLTVFTYVVWFIVSLPIGYYFVFCCASQPESFEDRLFFRTLGLPVSYICGVFPELSNLLGSTACEIANFLPLAGLFVLGLLPLVLVKFRTVSHN